MSPTFNKTYQGHFDGCGHLFLGQHIDPTGKPQDLFVHQRRFGQERSWRVCPLARYLYRRCLRLQREREDVLGLERRVLQKPAASFQLKSQLSNKKMQSSVIYRA